MANITTVRGIRSEITQRERDLEKLKAALAVLERDQGPLVVAGTPIVEPVPRETRAVPKIKTKKYRNPTPVRERLLAALAEAPPEGIDRTLLQKRAGVDSGGASTWLARLQKEGLARETTGKKKGTRWAPVKQELTLRAGEGEIPAKRGRPKNRQLSAVK